MAARQAKHYPPQRAKHWGKTLHGAWTAYPELVAEYG